MTTIGQYKIQETVPAEVVEWLDKEAVGERYKLAAMDVSPQDQIIETEEILSWLRAKLGTMQIELTYSRDTLATAAPTSREAETAAFVVTTYPGTMERYRNLVKILEQQPVVPPAPQPLQVAPAHPEQPAPLWSAAPTVVEEKRPAPLPSPAPAPARGQAVVEPAPVSQVPAGLPHKVLLMDTDGDRYVDSLYGEDGKKLDYSAADLKKCFARMFRGTTRIEVNSEVTNYLNAYLKRNVDGLGPEYQTTTRSVVLTGAEAREVGVAEGEVVEYFSMQAVYANIVTYAVREAGLPVGLIPREHRVHLDLVDMLFPALPVAEEEFPKPTVSESQILFDVPYAERDPEQQIKSCLRILKNELAQRQLSASLTSSGNSTRVADDIVYVGGVPHLEFQRSSRQNSYIPTLSDFALSALRMIDQRANEIAITDPAAQLRYRKQAAQMVAHWYNRRVAEGLVCYQEMHKGENSAALMRTYQEMAHGMLVAASREVPFSLALQLSIASPTPWHPYPRLVVNANLE